MAWVGGSAVAGVYVCVIALDPCSCDGSGGMFRKGVGFWDCRAGCMSGWMPTMQFERAWHEARHGGDGRVTAMLLPFRHALALDKRQCLVGPSLCEKEARFLRGNMMKVGGQA